MKTGLNNPYGDPRYRLILKEVTDVLMESQRISEPTIEDATVLSRKIYRRLTLRKAWKQFNKPEGI